MAQLAVLLLLKSSGRLAACVGGRLRGPGSSVRARTAEAAAAAIDPRFDKCCCSAVAVVSLFRTIGGQRRCISATIAAGVAMAEGEVLLRALDTIAAGTRTTLAEESSGRRQHALRQLCGGPTSPGQGSATRAALHRILATEVVRGSR